MKRIFWGVILVFWATTVQAALVVEELEYQSGDTVLKGYLAYDDSFEGKRPGVLVVHEWWGHNDYARQRAAMLAELGYTALALDMYGDGKQAQHPDDAGKFAGMIRKDMQGVGKDRFLAALAVLKSHETVDRKTIAAMGYCFGGGTVLHMARFGVDLKGVVSFHGGLDTETPAQPGQVKARILVCHGADDKFIPQEQIDAFKEEMEEAGADYQFISYEGATHSFTNPKADQLAEEFGIPLAYNEQADQQSWQDMQDFFNEIFQ